MNGPRLVALAALAMVSCYTAFLAVHGADEEGLRILVRATARVSLGLFSAAFAASSLQRVWPWTAGARLLRNRRYVGLSFAFSHLLHGLAIAWLAGTAPDFQTNALTLIGGGFAYVMIVLMAATSNDAAVSRLGRSHSRAPVPA